MQLSPEKLAQKVHGSLFGKFPLALTGFSGLEQANSSHISFYTKNTSSESFEKTRAGLILVSKKFPKESFANFPLLIVENPYHSIIQLAKQWYFSLQKPIQKFIHPASNIHSTAVINGRIERGVVIGPHCVVEENSVVQENAVLEASVTISQNVQIGKNCVIHSGAVLGSRGFGFYEYKGEFLPVPHFAGVILGEQCEVGSNAVVASGFLNATHLGNSCKMDSQTLIGHNCVLGNNVYMAGQSGIGGSCLVGNGVRLGGGAQIADHVKIGDHATLAAKSGVTRDIPAGMVVGGFPAVEISRWRKMILRLREGI